MLTCNRVVLSSPIIEPETLSLLIILITSLPTPTGIRIDNPLLVTSLVASSQAGGDLYGCHCPMREILLKIATMKTRQQRFFWRNPNRIDELAGDLFFFVTTPMFSKLFLNISFVFFFFFPLLRSFFFFFFFPLKKKPNMTLKITLLFFFHPFLSFPSFFH